MANLEKLTFCLSGEEMEALEALQRRMAVHVGVFNRSEVTRIALAYLARQSDEEVAAASRATTRFKPGRQRKSGSFET